MFVLRFKLGAEYIMAEKTTVPVINGEIQWSKIFKNETYRTQIQSQTVISTTKN